MDNMESDFELLICSPCNLEKLTCEIYYKNEFVGIITQETDEFMLDIYPFSEFKGWIFKLDEFQKVLEDAKSLLKN